MAAKCRQWLSDSRGCSRRPLAFVLYLPLQGHRRARSQLRASACVNGVIMRGIRGAKLYGSRTKGLKISLCAAALALPTLVVVQAGGVGAAPAVTTAHGAQQRPMTATLAAQLSKNVDQHVIVIMKSQLAAARVGSRAGSAAGRGGRRLPGPAHERAPRGARHACQELRTCRLLCRHCVIRRGNLAQGRPGGGRSHPRRHDPGSTARDWRHCDRIFAIAEVWAVRRRHAAHCERDTRRVRHRTARFSSIRRAWRSRTPTPPALPPRPRARWASPARV